jgi:hypothetical protein
MGCYASTLVQTKVRVVTGYVMQIGSLMSSDRGLFILTATPKRKIRTSSFESQILVLTCTCTGYSPSILAMRTLMTVSHRILSAYLYSLHVVMNTPCNHLFTWAKSDPPSRFDIIYYYYYLSVSVGAALRKLWCGWAFARNHQASALHSPSANQACQTGAFGNMPFQPYLVSASSAFTMVWIRSCTRDAGVPNRRKPRILTDEPQL